MRPRSGARGFFAPCSRKTRSLVAVLRRSGYSARSIATAQRARRQSRDWKFQPPGRPSRQNQLSAAAAALSCSSALRSARRRRSRVLPVEAAVRGPSLFESAERIAGDTLERISADLGDCTRCKLHRQRHKIVFGAGNPHAELVFVGEGPGHDEDMQGIPFVGRAGKLLTQMIEAMGLTRDRSTSPTW